MTIKLVHNVATGEVSEVELTADELAQLEADKAEKIKQTKAAQAKQTSKSELLDRLGITAEEADVLLG
jgi:predicted DNA-binding protein (UPF0251 family)